MNTLTTTMICAACRSALRNNLVAGKALGRSDYAAARLTHSSRAFATTSLKRSHVGGAPLTIPPNVSFKILPPPAVVSGFARTEQPGPIVEMEGPMGE